MSRSKFWIVLGKQAHFVRHSSQHDAKKEAERYAGEYPGSEFTVMEAIASVVKSDIRWEKHEEVVYCENDPFV